MHRLVFRRCLDCGGKGWIPIIVADAGVYHGIFGTVCIGGGGAVPCICIAGYRLERADHPHRPWVTSLERARQHSNHRTV